VPAFSRLTWIQRITIVLCVIVLTNWLMASATGYVILGGDLFTIFLIVFVIVLALTIVRPLIRRLLGRVRGGTHSEF
jgi:uncharacterized membrane protein